MSTTQTYSWHEEFANATTHGIGVALGIAALVILSVASVEHHNAWKVVSSVLFGSTIVLMYLASTLYHSIQKIELKRFFKTLDHTSIYLLIAGSYTPFALVNLRGGWGWSLFGVIWGLALAGLIFKIFFVYRFQVVSLIVYLLMGWTALVAINPIYHHVAFGGLVWLVLGGLFYTIGTIFYSLKRLKFSHSIWHLFVLAGTTCHFFAVLYYVIPT